MREQLAKRLRYLWTFELANGLLIFPFLYYTLSGVYTLGWFSLVALLGVCTILIVGASFWIVKARAFQARRPVRRPATRRFYRATKYVFSLMVVALLALFVVRAFIQEGASLAELVVGGALLVMALLEYINYYWVQLSYDSGADLGYLLRHRRLKRATMVRDLGI